MSMIAIIDYKAGNLTSVERALAHIGEKCRITNRLVEIQSAERVILPGVGAAGAAMDVMKTSDLDRVIYDVIGKGVPFLGICLGAQIILDRSEENSASCLGVIRGSAKKFDTAGLKIPHMGWNNISAVRRHPVLAGIDERAQYYFVHSYYPYPERRDDIVATTEYGVEFPSIIGKENVVAMQFHPEKSGEHGLRILKNFCDWDGTV
jgi:glutamine amidotransferase